MRVGRPERRRVSHRVEKLNQTMPLTAEKICLELQGVSYEDVKGSTMGLCFAGHPDAYQFHTKRRGYRRLAHRHI